MRMGGQVPGPGVEDTSPADLPAEVVGVYSQGLSGSRGGLKEQVVHASVVRAGSRSQCLRQRKGDQKVRDRQQKRPLLFQPPGGRVILTLGTMPVLTRMIAILEFSAPGALGEMPAKGRSPARFNRRHGGQVAGEQAIFALGPICWAIAPEEVRQFAHDRPPQAMRALRGGD